MKFRCYVLTILAWITLTALRAPAAVQLASPFTDHMVLQQGLPTAVWGTASPGDGITVTFRDQSATATAAADGHWQATLPPTTAGGPFKMTVAGKENQITLDDVLVGEVWLASGQSNMDFTVAKTTKYYFAGVANEAEEVAAAKYPQIRMFSGEWTKRYEPQQRIDGTWKICNPQNVREFSAIGYFFARDLQRELKVPVGILTMTFGASTAQAWIRREAIEANPLLKPTLDTFDKEVTTFRSDPERLAKYQTALKEWQATTAPATDRAPGERPPRAPSNPDPVNNQHNPTVLFNGMIAPIIPYTVRGIIWYQGESILDPRRLFPLWNETLITDWRKLWGSELPFLFVQIAAYKAPATQPSNSQIAEVREMQTEILKLPNTGMAITIDIGDAKSIHPRDKQDVGDRLMRVALATVYHHDIVAFGPTFDSATPGNHAIQIHFTNVGGGLIAKGGPLKQFAIAGADKKFVSADAQIHGKDAVIVSSPAIADPEFVRYAWADNPAGCNLYNDVGLPGVPFRTDGPAR